MGALALASRVVHEATFDEVASCRLKPLDRPAMPGRSAIRVGSRVSAVTRQGEFRSSSGLSVKFALLPTDEQNNLR